MVVSRLRPPGAPIVGLRGLRAAVQYDNKSGSFRDGGGYIELGVEVSGIGSEVDEGLNPGSTPGSTGLLRRSKVLVQTCEWFDG